MRNNIVAIESVFLAMAFCVQVSVSPTGDAQGGQEENWEHKQQDVKINATDVKEDRAKVGGDKPVPIVEIQVNAKLLDLDDDEADDFACTVGTIKCRARLRKEEPEDIDVVLVNVANGGDVGFPAAEDKALTLPSGGEWKEFEISGVGVSSELDDAEIEARSGAADGPKLGWQKLTVIDVRKIPLGAANNLTKFIIGKAYIPTKWGGDQKLSGSNVQLFFTDGSDLDGDTAIKIFKGELDTKRVSEGEPCEYKVAENKHRWYYAKVGVAEATAISWEFTQGGAAKKKPWNGWFWPKMESDDPNLYDNTGECTPLKDYDAVYGTVANIYESLHYKGGTVGWAGHCDGWAKASVAIDQPKATTKVTEQGNIVFTQDEMEGLYTELGQGASGGLTWRFGLPPDPEAGLPAEGPPAVKPTDALGEDADAWPGKLHNVLREYVWKREEALMGDLRDEGGTDPVAVWNHALYKYRSRMKEAPGGNEKIVDIETDTTANMDGPWPVPDTAKRVDNHLYILEYKDDGTIDIESEKQNWRKASGYPPGALATVLSTAVKWKAKHTGPDPDDQDFQELTKENVDALYE